MRPRPPCACRAPRGARLARRFDVLLFPSISAETLRKGRAGDPARLAEPRWPEAYRRTLTQGIVGPRLRELLAAGGSIVAWNASTSWLVDELGLPVAIELEELSPEEFFAPGTLLRTDFDRAHPLAWGMPAQVAVYFARGRAYRPLAWPQPTAVAARYARSQLNAAGFLIGEERIAGRPALLDIPVDRGRVILFGFGPQVRAQPEACFKLLFNAMLRAASERESVGG